MNRHALSVCRAVRDAGGRAMVVGGWVRDHLLGFDSKDLDLEVYGIPSEQLLGLLQRIGPVNTVGESFTVYKLTVREEDSNERIEIDVSIPRRESKSGRGHRGFVVEGDPTMSFAEAARRRDFTINAVLFDPLTDEIIDPFGGAGDLKRRVLKAVAAETFVEDSLRVLRGVQLAARFELTIDARTAELCRSIDLSDLPRERVWGEFDKLLSLAKRPSIGLQLALDLGVLDKLFPEIRALHGCSQDPEVHPEGDAFVHTLLCVDQAIVIARDLTAAKRISVALGALCHDLGKPLMPATNCDGHDEAGVAPTAHVLKKLGIHSLDGFGVHEQVIALVREHLKPREFYRNRDRTTNGDLRRLARRVNPDLLYRLAWADGMACGGASSSRVADWFIEQIRSLGIEQGPPPPLLLGRHLLEIGIKPGPQMGEILRQVYELQLDDDVTTLDEAIQAARNLASV